MREPPVNWSFLCDRGRDEREHEDFILSGQFLLVIGIVLATYLAVLTRICFVVAAIAFLVPFLVGRLRPGVAFAAFVPFVVIAVVWLFTGGLADDLSEEDVPWLVMEQSIDSHDNGTTAEPTDDKELVSFAIATLMLTVMVLVVPMGLGLCLSMANYSEGTT
jgi:hypothetical protein